MYIIIIHIASLRKDPTLTPVRIILLTTFYLSAYMNTPKKVTLEVGLLQANLTQGSTHVVFHISIYSHRDLSAILMLLVI